MIVSQNLDSIVGILTSKSSGIWNMTKMDILQILNFIAY